MIRIERHLVSELPKSVLQELKIRVDREFGSVAIVRDHVWAEPTWTFLGYAGEQLVSFLNVVDRQAQADDNDLRLFGINNVITEPQHRGKGHSKILIQTAVEFVSDCDPRGCGFLFCADDLVTFYTKLGWKKFKGVVTVSQPSGDIHWPSNAMFYDLSQSRSWRAIHLCGLPW